jgi:hypothetical protein
MVRSLSVSTFRHIPDRCALGLHLPPLGGHVGAFRLEVGKNGALSRTLVMSGTGVSRGMRRQFAAVALAHG